MFRASLIVAALLLVAPLHAGVIVVDAADGPGTDFTSLWLAGNAAANGDVLLVRSGSYDGLLIDGKSLSVVADAGADVQVAFALPEQMTEVRNLAPGQTVLLQGLHLRAIPASPLLIPYNGCFVHDCQGAVWLDDCVVEAGVPSLLVKHCKRVIVAGGSILGGLSASPALRVDASNVVVAGSTVLGADGQDAGLGPFANSIASTPGATGIGLFGTASQLTLAGCNVRGGHGGAGYWYGGNVCGEPSNGGDGLLISAEPGAGARIADTLFVGGASGGSTTCGETSSPGLGVHTVSGSAVFLLGTPATLSAAGPTREGQSLALNVQGTAGDLAWLLLSPQPGGKLFLGAKEGQLLLDPLFTALTLGPLPAGGALALSAHVPDLGPGVESLAVFAQVVTIGAGVTMGTGSALVLLDAGL